jgi:hypothetical protein
MKLFGEYRECLCSSQLLDALPEALYRVIHKPCRSFRTRMRNNQDRHTRKEHINTCEVGHKLGVSLPLLTCSPSAWPPRLLYRRGRKSPTDLRITLYIHKMAYAAVSPKHTYRYPTSYNSYCLLKSPNLPSHGTGFFRHNQVRHTYWNLG